MPFDNELPIQGGSLRIPSLADIDGRTKVARHVKETKDGLVADCGGYRHISVAQQSLAERAAVLSAVVEGHEAQWAQSGEIDFKEYLPACNALRRILCDLGLERRQRQVPELSEYAAGRLP